MEKKNMKDVLLKISLKINTNLFTLILYYCVAIVLLSLLIDQFLGNQITKSKYPIIENIGLGITLGFLHRFILIKKDISLFYRVVLGLLMIIFFAFIYVIVIKLL